MTPTRDIILIHGNFVNNHAWAQWKTHYESLGYTVHTPANPGHDGHPADLRENVHPDLGDTGFVEVVQHIEALIDTLDHKPFVIGHSMGGAAVMKLVEADKVAAGVSIHGAPPQNIFPAPIQTLLAVAPAFGLFSSGRTWLGGRAWFDSAFFNTLPEADRAAAYDAHAVPESHKVSRQLVFHSFSRVDFSKPHVPLLFMGGTADNIFPPSLTRRIAGAYRDPDSRVEAKIYEGRSHFTCGAPGWQTVAEDALAFLESAVADRPCTDGESSAA